MKKLVNRAREALKNAHAPYSRFRVGAAVEGSSGTVYLGCNVENASFGATICAERSAVFAAVTGGEKSIKAVALVTETDNPVTPCGMCRQVLSEFCAPSTRITCATAVGDNSKTYTLDSLLPYGFAKSNLSTRPRVKRG